MVEAGVVDDDDIGLGCGVEECVESTGSRRKEVAESGEPSRSGWVPFRESAE